MKNFMYSMFLSIFALGCWACGSSDDPASVMEYTLEINESDLVQNFEKGRRGSD